MRGAGIIAAALVVGTLSPSTARAGVYFTTGTTLREFAKVGDPRTQELWPGPSPYTQFRLDLADYRSAVVRESPIHKHYQQRVTELKAAEAMGLLSLDDRINLGAYYIRLGQYKDAIRVLQEAQHSRHFLLQANLAAAYELADPEKEGGDLRLAIRSREMALDYWPAMYAGWDSRMLNFYRKAEQYHLALLKLRQAEPPPAQGQSRLRLDNLFPRIRLVGPSGKYEAGTIAPKQWCELPADAVDLVMQLHLWMPFDDRLGWLLGELFNASGNVGAAAEMMNRVVKTLEQAQTKESAVPEDLREHWQIVTKAANQLDKFITDPELQKDRYWRLKLLCVMAPRGLGLGAGDLIQEASWPAILMEDEANQNQKTDQTSATASLPSPPSASESWVPNWRQLAVGFGTGALVALLLGMQIRQMGRGKG